MDVKNAPIRKTTIVLADDHRVVREGLHVLLEAERDFSVVGDAGDGLAAIRLVDRLKPDVLLLDLMMPGLNGQEVARRVGKLSPKTRIVVLSMHSSEPYVMEALRNGAAGYVLKDASGADLIHAVREVMAGRRYLSPPLSERAIDAYQEKAKSAAWERYDMLTTRERETLQLVAEGRTNNEIASRLGISPRTAETHRTHLMRKLQLRTHTDLIKYAIERGIIPLDQR
jgi:two-component system, NarL family, response regulator NreC